MSMYGIIWGSMAVLCIVGLAITYAHLFHNLFDSDRNVVEFLVDEGGNFVGVSISSTIRPDGKPKKCRVKVRVLSDEEVNEFMEREDI